MRFPIGLKIFGIAVGLLILMGAVALLSMQMMRTVDAQLAIIDQNYFPAYVVSPRPTFAPSNSRPMCVACY